MWPPRNNEASHDSARQRRGCDQILLVSTPDDTQCNNTYSASSTKPQTAYASCALVGKLLGPASRIGRIRHFRHPPLKCTRPQGRILSRHHHVPIIARPSIAMILGPISLFDCLVFCLLLAPQLIWHVGLVRTSGVVLRALPFLRRTVEIMSSLMALTSSSYSAAAPCRPVPSLAVAACIARACFCARGVPVRVSRDKMRAIRIQVYSARRRQHLLLQECEPALPAMAHVEARHRQVSRPLA